MSSFLWVCAKKEAKKLAKPRGFLKKSLFKENVVAPTNQVLHLNKFDIISFEIYFIKFFKILTFKAHYDPIFGRIKIQTCQTLCNLADLPASF